MLNELLNNEIKTLEDINNIVKVELIKNEGFPARVDELKLKKAVKNLIKECEDLNVIQSIALKFDDKFNFMFDCEDKLMELMGEDEACDWMDENDLA